MTNDPAGVREASKNVVALKPRVRAQEVVHGVSRREHAQHVFDGQTATPNNRLPAEDLRINCNAP
jgi:hypothetical protein